MYPEQDQNAVQQSFRIKVSSNRRALLVAVVPVVVAALLISGLLWQVSRNAQPDGGTSIRSIDLAELQSLDHAVLDVSDTQRLIVNGELRANGAFVLSGQEEPSNPQAGEVYFDNDNNNVRYYNGTQFVDILSSGDVAEGGDTNAGDDLTISTTFAGDISGPFNDLQIEGNAVTSVEVQDGSLSNGDLENSTITVSTGAGLSGGGTVSLGSSVVLQSVLGSSINTTEIDDDTILAADLNNVSAPGVSEDGYVLTYDHATGGFEWVATGGGITSLNGLIAAAQTFTNDTNVTVVSAGSTHTLTWNGQLSVARGGTGASAAQGAINNISGLTTNGDLLYFDGVNSSGLARGSNGQCLNSNATTILWGTCGGAFTSTVGLTELNTSTDTVTIGSSTVGGKLFVDGDADEIQLQVQGNGTQTSDVVVVENSSGTDIFTVDGSGNVAAAGGVDVGTGETYNIGGVIALAGSGGYLRLNQSSQFASGIYTGSSPIRVGGSTGVIVGSTGGDGQIVLKPNGLDTTRRVTVDGGAGSITLGAASANNGSLILQNATNAFTVTLNASAQTTGSTVISLPDTGADTADTVCLVDVGNCSGGTTLQGAYDNSTSPEITLDGTRGALTVRDNATPIGANLLEVQDNGGTLDYLAVDATATSIYGNLVIQSASSGSRVISARFNADNSGIDAGTYFQTDQTNENTYLTIAPNGTASTSAVWLWSDSTISNNSYAGSIDYAGTTDGLTISTRNFLSNGSGPVSIATEPSGGSSPIDRLIIDDAGTVNFNPTGTDSDFIIQGSTDTELFYVDAGNDRIGISTGSPGATLDVGGTLAVSGLATFNANLRVADTGGDHYITLRVEADEGSDYNLYVPTEIATDDYICLEVAGNCSGGSNEFTAVVATSDSVNAAAADYTADGTADEVEINQAIDAVNTAGGGTVFLLEGTYNIAATIDIDANVHLVGSGTEATIINVASSGSVNAISEDSNPDHFSIRDLAIDANRSITGTQIGIDLSSTGTLSGSSSGSGGVINNVEIHDFDGSAIRLTNSAVVTITNSHIYDGSGGTVAGVEITNLDGDIATIVSNNIIHNITSGYGVYVSDSQGVNVSDNNIYSVAAGIYNYANTTITGNTITNVSSVGIASDGYATITSNSLVDNTGNSIALDSDGYNAVSGNYIEEDTSASISVNSPYNIISGNVIGLSHGGTSLSGGIHLTGSGDNNSVTGNSISDPETNGIYLASGADNNTISGNAISLAAYGGIFMTGADSNVVANNKITTYGISSGSSDGIAVAGNSDNNQITGNRITDTAGSGQAIDLQASTVDNAYLADNTYSGTGATTINDLGTGTIYANQINSSGELVTSDIYLEERLILGVDSQTVADSGDANPATLTLNPSSSYIEITCNDVDTCDITMDEALPVTQGQTAFIVNVSANSVDFADSSGVQEVSANPVALGQYDTLTLIYSSDRWIQFATSDN